MRFGDSDLECLVDLLAQAGAEEVMPRFRRLKRDEVREKSASTDLVTEADVRAEALIVQALRERHPQALVVAEEACAADPGRIAGLAQADLAFAIDPLDGTFNFAAGVPLFAVMGAVLVKGEAVAGIIHDPVGRDSLIAMRGAGAHVRDEDGTTTTVRVAEPAPVAQMIGSLAWQFLPLPERRRLARNHTRCLAAVGYRCAAHEYRLIATGHAHFALYGRLMPWDHVAGALIHAEAGGFSARFDGSRYTAAHLDGGLLAATDPESWRALREALWEE